MVGAARWRRCGGRRCDGTCAYRAGDKIRNLTQRTGAGELVHDALHGLLLLGRAELLQRGQNFDAFDGIDAQVGFDAGIQVQHLRRIAGSLGGDGAQFSDEVAAGGCRCGRGSSGRRCSCGGGASNRAGDQIRNFTQRSGAGQLVHDALHGLLLFGRAELLQGGQDFHALDGVDAQVGFDAGVQVQHFRRIAGSFGGYRAQFRDEVAAGGCGGRGGHAP